MNIPNKTLRGYGLSFGFGAIVAGVSIRIFTGHGPEYLGIALGIVALICGIIPLAQMPDTQTSLDALAEKIAELHRDISILRGESGTVIKFILLSSSDGGKTSVPEGEYLTSNPMPSIPRVKKIKP